MSLNRLRLGKRRRQLLLEAAGGHSILCRGDTAAEKAARRRAAYALQRAGLVTLTSVLDYDDAGRWLELRAAVLTDLGREVVLAWRVQLEARRSIRWRHHERMAAAVFG